jgi:hypothetical protein
MVARSQGSLLVRIVCGSACIWLALAVAACGSTKRTPTQAAVGEGGADGGAAPQSSGGMVTGGSFTGAAGSLAEGGAFITDGGSPPAEGGAAPVSNCVEGAPCTCGDLTGTLQCSGSDVSEGGSCSCPPAEACEAPSGGSCFEPCGGDALGLWILEETCFPGAEIGDGCAGGAISGTSASHELKLEILENEPVRFGGGESLELRAQVPLQCLGVESVNRCADADFYASPLYFGYSRPLDCEASECGFCECSGEMHGGGGVGKAWTPGSPTLAFGAIDVPYCVEGDVMWAGGGEILGEPKVAYKLRRRSCVGTPLPCAERESGQCGAGCSPGRCLPDGGDAVVCAEQSYEEGCAHEAGCKWVEGGCWGTAMEACDSEYCAETPGCEWGPPKARCGGELASCFDVDPSKCHSAGCSMRTCDVPEGWGGVDSAPCSRLTVSACPKAAGCAVSGGACTGTTKCAPQTDATVCGMLECAVYEEPRCGGFTTTPCAELSLEDCRSQPGCRFEW